MGQPEMVMPDGHSGPWWSSPGESGLEAFPFSIPTTPGEAVMAHHVPTHRRSSLDADGRPQVSAMVALLVAAAIVLLVLATSAVSNRLVG
jgi:small neutral amino acid transporter SnatA (MarC family)